MIWTIYKVHEGREWFLVDHNKKSYTWSKNKHKSMLFADEQDAKDCINALFNDPDTVGLRCHFVDEDGRW